MGLHLIFVLISFWLEFYFIFLNYKKQQPIKFRHMANFFFLITYYNRSKKQLGLLEANDMQILYLCRLNERSNL